jgi:AcrR family transcriptional regulator
VEQRRAQARAVVLRLLGEGRRFENVSLRDVAEGLGVPLSTLTYAYSSITDLLDDFAGYVDDQLLPRLGSQGLRLELIGYVEQAAALLQADPGLREVWRYRLARIGQDWLAGEAQDWGEVIGRVRAAAGERYRMSDERLGRGFWSLLLGELVIWLDGQDPDPFVLRDDLISAVDLLVRAADPQLPPA